MAHSAVTLQQAFHYLWPDEVPALKELACMLPSDPVIVNIGAGAGTSGLAFAESRRDAVIYTVDIQRESSPFGCLEAQEQVLREAGFDVDGYHSRFIQIVMDSKELGFAWTAPKGSKAYKDASLTGVPIPGMGKQPVDMVFIDGDHSYEGASGDIINWLPNIKPGGIIAVHDYDKAEVYKREHVVDTVPHPKPWPGVDQAVKELLLGKYPVILQVDTLIAFRVEPLKKKKAGKK